MIVYTITEDAIDGYEDPHIEWDPVEGLFKVTNCPKPRPAITPDSPKPTPLTVYVVPKTDYDSNIEKWIALFVVSLGSLLVLLKRKKIKI